MMKGFFLFLITLGIIILPVSAMCGEELSIDLYPGWNFISVPHSLPDGYNTGAIFSNVETAGHSIWLYDAGISQYIRVTSSTQIHPLNGIWIYSNSRSNITVLFSQEPQMVTKQLYPGWNAVGYAGCTPISANITFFPVKDHWSRIIGYDANTQIYEMSIINHGTSSHNDVRLLFPTKGYWIYINDPCSISYSSGPEENLTTHPGDTAFVHFTMRDELDRPVLTTNEQIFNSSSQKGEDVWLSGPIPFTVGSTTNDPMVPISVYHYNFGQVDFALFPSELNQIAAGLSGMKQSDVKYIAFTYDEEVIHSLSREEFIFMGGNFTTVKIGDQFNFGFNLEAVGPAFRTGYIIAKNETTVSFNLGFKDADISIINFSSLNQ